MERCKVFIMSIAGLVSFMCFFFYPVGNAYSDAGPTYRGVGAPIKIEATIAKETRADTNIIGGGGRTDVVGGGGGIDGGAGDEGIKVDGGGGETAGGPAGGGTTGGPVGGFSMAEGGDRWYALSIERWLRLYFLYVALSFYLISIFLARESVAMLRWSIRDEKNALNPSSGWVSVLLMLPCALILSFLFWRTFYYGDILFRSQIGVEVSIFLNYLLVNFDVVTMMLMASSLYPLVYSIYKFLTAKTILGKNQDFVMAGSYNGASLLGAVFSLVSAVGSVASIVALYLYLKEN